MISSSKLVVTSFYLMNLRNQIKKFESDKDLLTLDFKNCYFLNYQQIYEVPKLEEIKNFNLRDFMKKNDISKSRNIDISNLKSLIMVLDKKGLSDEELLEELLNSYKYYPHDYFMIVYPEYYKYFKESINNIFYQDNTIALTQKYLIAIIVSKFH